MPQVHNRSVLLDGNAFGKNSRFMNTQNYSLTTKRRVRAFNVVENRLVKYKINYYNRQEEIELNRRQRQKEQLLTKMKRLMAYKRVAERHNLSNYKNYQTFLNEDRSPRVIKKEVQEMIKCISPQYTREQRAREKIAEAKQRYDDILRKNREQIDIIYPPNTKWPTGNEDSDDSESNVSTPEPPSPTNPQLRMRRMTIDHRRRTLAFSRAFVIEKSNLGEKLEKEKTLLEQQTHNVKSPAEQKTDNEAINKQSNTTKNELELPPVVTRKQSLKDVTKTTKTKRNEKPDYELAPVSLSKKLKPELDVRSD